MIITNLFPRSKAQTMTEIGIKANGTWSGVNPVADGDHWRIVIDPSWDVAVYPTFFNAWRDTGDVVVITADANADMIWVQNSTLISHTGTMAAYRIGASSLGDAGIYFKLVEAGLQSGEGITITGYGVYTAKDWAALQKLGLDYFDGGTMPLAS